MLLLWGVTWSWVLGLSLLHVDGKVVFWLQKSWRLAVMTMKVFRHSGNPTQVAIIPITIGYKHDLSMLAWRMRCLAWNS